MKEIYRETTGNITVVAHINKPRTLVYVDVITPYRDGTKTSGFAVKVKPDV